MKTRIKDISLHCFNFMYKLYGRNTCAFGIEAELSVPAAGSQSDPYFNVNKRGISFISLSLSTNNKPEKSPFHFQLLVQSWETEQGQARGSAGPRAPPWMDWKKRRKERTCCLTKKKWQGLESQVLLLFEGQSWEVQQEGGWTSAWQVMESTSECQSAFQLSLETHVLLIRLLKLDYEL